MKRLQLVAMGVVAAFALGGGIATAAVEAAPSVKACQDKNGVLSLLGKGKCAKGTHEFRLAVQGPRGLTGKTGAAGATGTPGSVGAPGQPGPAGPSNVYGWNGQLHFTSPNSPIVTVPAGSYVLRWQGWVNDTNMNGDTVACDLLENGTGTGITVTVAAGQAQPDSYEDLVTSASAFTIQVTCTGLIAGVNLVDTVLTATATGSLQAIGVTTP